MKRTTLSTLYIEKNFEIGATRNNKLETQTISHCLQFKQPKGAQFQR